MTSPGNGTALPDISSNDANRAISRSFSYDADQRYFHLQRDGLVSRSEKSVTHFQEDSLRQNTSACDIEFLDSWKKWDGVEPAVDLKLGCSEFSEKTLATKVELLPLYIKPSSKMYVLPV